MTHDEQPWRGVADVHARLRDEIPVGAGEPARAAVFLQLMDAVLARRWVAGASAHLVAGPDLPDQGAHAVHATLGLSAWGLHALGIPHRELAALPAWFRSGIAASSTELGFTGASAPQHWRVPFRRVEPDGVLLLAAPTNGGLLELAAAWAADLGAHGIVVVDRFASPAGATVASGPGAPLVAGRLGAAHPPMPPWSAGGTYLRLVWSTGQPDAPAGGTLDRWFGADLADAPSAAQRTVIGAGVFFVPSLEALDQLAQLRTIA